MGGFSNETEVSFKYFNDQYDKGNYPNIDTMNIDEDFPNIKVNQTYEDRSLALCCWHKFKNFDKNMTGILTK